MLDLKAASEIIKSGKTIAVPCIQGFLLLSSGQSEESISVLKAICKLGESVGLNLWVENEGRINKHVTEVPEVAWDLIDSTEGEITLVLPQGKHIAKTAIFEDGYIAMTLTKLDWAKRLIQQAKSPIVVVNWQSTELPSNMDLQILDLSFEKTPLEMAHFSVIKIADDGGIKILRRQGNKILPHL